MDAAEPTRERRSARRTLIAVLAVALVAAAAVIAYVLTSSPAPHGPAPAPAALPLVSSLPPPPTTTAPAKPAVPHEYVAGAVPTEFTLTGKQFTINAHVCAMANIRPYDPPGEQEHTVCWVRSGFGVKPSSKQPATSYVFGHSWAEDPLEVLNKESRLATTEILHTKPVTRYGVPVWPVHSMDGYLLKLKTHAGTLTYKVREGYGVRKDQLGSIKSWLDPTIPNRIVLTTCAELGGVDYDYNIVLEAGLYSSTRAKG